MTKNELQMSYVRELKQYLKEALFGNLEQDLDDDDFDEWIRDADRDLTNPAIAYAWGRLLGAAEMIDMTVLELLDAVDVEGDSYQCIDLNCPDAATMPYHDHPTKR